MAQAVERRLSAIYDALDSRNNKLALKLIASALQKQPKNQMLRVLKAVALQRSGKDEEGLQVCEDVRSEVPTDEQLLNTMTIVYRRANRLKDMSAAFAAASAARPQDEGLLRGVFTSYVRDFDFAGQQQIASKLHKLAGPRDHYYIWWTIVAITLQAKAAQQGATSALPASKLFQLAEVMIAKQVQKGSLKSYEQLMLYLYILQAQEKQQQALQLVEGSAGDVISMPAERRALKASLHFALGHLDKAAALFKEALYDNPDDWTSLQQYLGCILSKRNASGDGQAGEQTNMYELSVQDQLQEAEETVQEMLSKVQSDPYLKAAAARGVIRGPQLAQVELELRKLISAYGGTKADSTRFTGQQKEQLPQEAMEPDGQADTAKGSHVGHNGQHKAEQQRAVVGSDRQGNSRSLAQAVFGYYKQLGHMLSCAVDLRAYTKRIEGHSRTWLMQTLQAELDSLKLNSGSEAKQQEPNGAAGDSPSMEALLQLRRQISAYQIQHDLDLSHKSASAAEAHAAELLILYKHSLTLCKGLDPKEKAPGDDLIPLAVASLMAARNLDVAGNAVSGSGNQQDRAVQKRLLQALLACEAGQKRSTVDAATRFACTALYGLLGAAAPAATNFDALAIKHIQHDTITGHHMLPVALACQDTATIQKVLTETMQLYEDHDRDAGDTIMMAYEKGTFTKVLEFVEFKQRLQMSHTLAVMRSEMNLSKVRKAIPRGFASVQSALQEASNSPALSSGVTQVSELPSLEQLRFNEDLSTRPAWSPPLQCFVGGALMEWWHQQQCTHDAGYGRCWWAEPAAAELPHQNALAFRQNRLHQLRIRHLMPNLMQNLTSIQTDSRQSVAASKEANGAPATSVDGVSHGMTSGTDQGLLELTALLGVPYPQLDSWLEFDLPSLPQLPQQWPSEEEEEEPQHGSGSLINLAAFAAADAGQAYMSYRRQVAAQSDPITNQSTQYANTFASRMAAVQTAFASSCQHIAQQLNLEPEHILLGSTLLAAVHLVSEPATWLCLCLLAWQHHFGAVKKKQRNKGKAIGVTEGSIPDHPGRQAVREQLSQLQQAYCKGLQGIVDAVNVRIKAPTEAQLANATKTVFGDVQQGPGLAQTLAGCLSQADVHAVLNSIITAQALTLKRIKLQASELMSAL